MNRFIFEAKEFKCHIDVKITIHKILKNLEPFFLWNHARVTKLILKSFGPLPHLTHALEFFVFGDTLLKKIFEAACLSHPLPSLSHARAFILKKQPLNKHHSR